MSQPYAHRAEIERLDEKAGSTSGSAARGPRVGTEGRFIGELSEGDVFGELGLLEGGTREANVTGVSVDAEVLFQHLLHTVPAFALGDLGDGGRPSRPNSPPVARCEHALHWSDEFAGARRSHPCRGPAQLPHRGMPPLLDGIAPAGWT